MSAHPLRTVTVRTFAAVLILGLAACADHGVREPSPPAGAAPTAPSGSAAAGNGVTCGWKPAAGGPDLKDVGTPPAAPPWHSGTVTMTLTSNLGPITIQMDAARTPCTTASFAYLAGRHFFDGSACHRLVNTTGFGVLQCGDPSGTGRGGPAYQFADENLTSVPTGSDGPHYPRGTVAMANAGPNTNGSQFFIVFADTRLGANYTPFGTVTSGLDLVQSVADAGDDEAFAAQAGGGHPNRKLTFQSVKVAP